MCGCPLCTSFDPGGKNRIVAEYPLKTGTAFVRVTFIRPQPCCPICTFWAVGGGSMFIEHFSRNLPPPNPIRLYIFTRALYIWLELLYTGWVIETLWAMWLNSFRMCVRKPRDAQNHARGLI